jgi:aminomuconate-semialdehyde/2-hydroxymuconate-6-semialdehyde dehydrogenase
MGTVGEIPTGTNVSGEHFVGGRRIGSTQRFSDRSPIDGEVLAEVARGDEDVVDEAVACARDVFADWASLGPKRRGEHLFALAAAIEARGSEFAALECVDAGARYEWMRDEMVPRSARNIRYFAEAAIASRAPAWRADGTTFVIRREPAGVAALITPWNAPLMLTTWKLGPSLASGCTVVVKPAEWAPLTVSWLAEIAADVGLPSGVFNVVHGYGEEAGAALVRHPGVSRISFTGSPDTAEDIGRAAASHLVPVSFELGGKSPLIVCSDADLGRAAETATAQYHHAGQICLAGTRLLVDESILEPFLRQFYSSLDTRILGDPRKSDTYVGPLITAEHLDRVAGFVDRAAASGAVILRGGKVSPALGGLYYEPTLVSEVSPSSEIVQQEVFGPVLTLQTFGTDEEAVKMGNDTAYGLAATVFTQSRARAQLFEEQLTAGTVWVNCYFVRDLSAPFGGCKRSGVGREGGTWSLDFYSDVKTVVER